MVKELDNSRVIQIFLWCVAGLFLCAFTSLYTQIPGLYGENGLTPAAYVLKDKLACTDKHRKCKKWSKQNQCKDNAEWMLESCAKSCNSCRTGIDKYFHYPTLLSFSPYLGLSTETGMELICLLGIFLSFYMLLSKSARDCVNYAILWTFYFSLIQVGQIFLYYQWDNLLLEMSFFAVLLAPWNLYIAPWNIFKCKRVPIFVQRHHDLVTWWLVKWLLFRLMFASGIVKLLWMDETWWNLTALNWHYESQCIPNSFAWYMHKLPVPFHRLSVLLTYIIEIAVPFLFFAPFRPLKIFAFYSQMLLQSMILMTGNYNFFNLATMALCLSLLDDLFLKFEFSIPQCCKALRPYLVRGRIEEEDPIKFEKKNQMKEEFVASSTIVICIRKLKGWIDKNIASKRLLKIEALLEGKTFQILGKVLQVTIFLGTVSCLLGIAVSYFGLRFDKHEFIHSEIKFTQSWFQHALPGVITTAMILGLISLLTVIMMAGTRCLLTDCEMRLKVVSLAQVILFGFSAVWIFGLTLVPFTDLDFEARNHVPALFVKQHNKLQKFNTINAYGLFRSMTGIGGRPEVIILGSNSLSENATWKEYNFIYKPGNIYSAPKFNVPHQPRLDWQMWFAALGDYKSNPWYVHLTYKLLKGEKNVLNLMSNSPFNKRPPKYVRSVLYRYHYNMNKTDIFKAIFNPRHEKGWWTREYVAEYMPIVSKNSTALLRQLRNFGLIRATNQTNSDVGWLHHFITSMRVISAFERTEFLIYAKFCFLIMILVIHHLWHHHGVNLSIGKRIKVETKLKSFLKLINSKVEKSS